MKIYIFSSGNPAVMKLTEVYDDLSMRFIICLPEADIIRPERLYFALEEAYWFFLDIIVIRYQYLYKSFREFCETILPHNSLTYKENDYKTFKLYKREVPVFGAVVLNPEMDSILAVMGKGNVRFGFPKGKKSKDETEPECCCREVYEEVGYDISKKITRINVMNAHAKLFFVFNVSEKAKFKPMSAYEISSINWLKISEIVDDKGNGQYSKLRKSILEINDIIAEVREKQFRFDIERIMKAVDLNVNT